MLEPSTGDSWRKLVLRLLGAGVAGGLSLLVLYIGARAACGWSMRAADWG